MDNMKYTLFDMAYFFDHTADYMQKVGNYEQAVTMSNKYEGVMAVIESLSLVEEYKTFVETGELK